MADVDVPADFGRFLVVLGGQLTRFLPPQDLGEQFGVVEAARPLDADRADGHFSAGADFDFELFVCHVAVPSLTPGPLSRGERGEKNPLPLGEGGRRPGEGPAPGIRYLVVSNADANRAVFRDLFLDDCHVAILHLGDDPVIDVLLGHPADEFFAER